jgi:hypothetical protein
MQMLGTRKALAEIDTATAPAFEADSRDSVDNSDMALESVGCSAVTFADSAGYRALVAALVASYPDWTDENGTNIEQLAAIAVAALEEAGMIDHDPRRPAGHVLNRRVES